MPAADGFFSQSPEKGASLGSASEVNTEVIECHESEAARALLDFVNGYWSLLRKSTVDQGQFNRECAKTPVFWTFSLVHASFWEFLTDYNIVTKRSDFPNAEKNQVLVALAELFSDRLDLCESGEFSCDVDRFFEISEVVNVFVKYQAAILAPFQDSESFTRFRKSSAQISDLVEVLNSGLCGSFIMRHQEIGYYQALTGHSNYEKRGEKKQALVDEDTTLLEKFLYQNSFVLEFFTDHVDMLIDYGESFDSFLEGKFSESKLRIPDASSGRRVIPNLFSTGEREAGNKRVREKASGDPFSSKGSELVSVLENCKRSCN